MASLLSWLGHTAKKVEQDVTHNPVTNFVGQNVVQHNPVVNYAAQHVAQPIGRDFQTVARNIPQIPATSPLRFANNAIINPIKTTDIHVAQALQGHNPYHGSIKQQLGQGLQDAINASSVVPLGRGAEVAAKGGLAIKAGLKTGAKVGAGFGAAQGLSTSAKNNLNLPQAVKVTALNTALGTAGGAALGGGLPLASAGVRGGIKVANNRVPLNQVGAVGKNMPENFLKQDPKVIAQNAKILNTTKAQATKALNSKLPPEANTIVNKSLAVKPPPPPKLPPTPPHTGDLVPMQDLPNANKLFSNKVNVLRKINTPSSHALADLVQTTDKAHEALRADYMSKIPTVHSLNNKQTGQMFDLVEKHVKPSEVSPKVQQAAKEWKTITPQIHQNAFHQGAIIGERQNYVPHSYPRGFFNQTHGSQYDSAIQHLMDKNQVNHQTAVTMFKDLAHQTDQRANWFGNFENSRMTDLPGYSKNKQALYDYIDGAAKRTAEAQHFGLDQQVANKLLQNIRMEGGDVNTATKTMENYMRSADKGMGAGTLRTLRAGFGVARLGKAGISHAGQTSNTLVDTTVHNTAAGWGRYLSRNAADKDFVARTGVTNPQVLHAYQDQVTSVRGLASKVTAPALKSIMTTNRSVTALAYRGYGNALAKKGAVDELRKLGVEGDIGKTLTPEQELQVARGGVNRTMFSPSRSTTPMLAETPVGKTVGQYRTAYAYKQTGFIYDRIIKEAQNGNLKPLYKYLTISAGVGGATIAAKNKISGSKEGAGGMATDLVGALGGIPGEVAVQAAKYGPKDLVKTTAGITAPLAGEAVTLGEAAQNAIKDKYGNHNLKPIEGYAAGLVPLVGGRLSKTVYGNKPKATAGQPATTTNAKGNVVGLNKTQTNATNTDRQAAWEGFTKKAKTNIRTNNPDLYTTRQTAEIAKEQAAGNTTQAFKDTRDLQKLGITRSYNKNLVGAYGLNATDFKAYLAGATPDQISQLQNLDAKLVDSGLVAKTKFTKATGYASRAKSTKTGSSKVARGSYSLKGPKASTSKISKPKGVSVRAPAAPKLKAASTRKLAVSKIPISYKGRKV